MSTALTTIESQDFSQSQLQIIKRSVAKDVNDDDFKLFIEVCKSQRLNPFCKQIYAINRGGKMTIQTGIDGFRLIADRTGKYAGQLGPFWCGPDGVWQEVWLQDDAPAAAKVGVLRNDFKEPLWGIARFKSYKQSSGLWASMPDVMIAKVAESLALRKAFPADMSGIYTDEEMMQADDEPAGRIVNATTVTKQQPDYVAMVDAILAEVGTTRPMLTKYRAIAGIDREPAVIYAALKTQQHKAMLWAVAHDIHSQTVAAYIDRERLDWAEMWLGIIERPDEVLSALQEMQREAVYA